MWNNDSPVQSPVIPNRCTNIDTNSLSKSSTTSTCFSHHDNWFSQVQLLILSFNAALWYTLMQLLVFYPNTVIENQSNPNAARFFIISKFQGVWILVPTFS